MTTDFKFTEDELIRVMKDRLEEYISFSGHQNPPEMKQWYVANFPEPKPTDAANDDIHPLLFELVSAITKAFNYIDPPIQERIDVAKKYEPALTEIFSELSEDKKNRKKYARKVHVGIEFLVYNNTDSGDIKPLIKGFNNLFFMDPPSYKIIFGKDMPKINNILVELLHFLAVYISLLDLQSSTPSAVDILNFLYDNNKNYFGILLDEFIGFFIDTNLFEETLPGELKTEDIKKAIGRYLVIIVDKLINKITEVQNICRDNKTLADIFNGEEAMINPSGYRLVNNPAFESFLKQIGITNNTVLTKIIPRAGSLNNLPATTLNTAQQLNVENYAAIQANMHKNAYWNFNLFNKPAIHGHARTTDFNDMKKTAPMDNLFVGGSHEGSKLYGGAAPPWNSANFLYYKRSKTAPDAGEYILANIDVDSDSKIGGLTIGNKAIVIDTKLEAVKNFIKGISDSVVPFVARAILIAYLNYFIENDADSTKKIADPNIISKIRADMKKTIENYCLIRQRVRKISDKYISKIIDDTKSIFIREFSREINNRYTISKGKLKEKKPGAPQPKPARKNLADSVLNGLYKKVIANDVSTYDKYFNLLKDEKPVPDLAEAKDETDPNELKKYRLNVKTSYDFTQTGGFKLFNMQFGGAGKSIVFITEIPNYPTSGRPPKLFIDMKTSIDGKDLKVEGVDAVRKLANEIYNSDPTANDIELHVNKKVTKINLQDLIKRLDSQNYAKTFAAFMKKILARPAPDITVPQNFEEYERNISTQLAGINTNWIRKDGSFAYIENGIEVATTPDDSCKFITEDTNKCINFMNDCVASANNSDMSSCLNTILKPEYKFEVNPSVIDFQKWVSKIDPLMAADFLDNLKFNQDLKADNFPVANFKRYKIQSVGEWLRNLPGYKDRLFPKAPQGAEERFILFFTSPSEYINKYMNNQTDAEKKTYKDKLNNFLQYLSVLVEWVNVNHQVLNPEENPGTAECPECYLFNLGDPQYNTYLYANPYKIKRRIGALCADLGRLKGSIINNITGGIDGESIISNVATVPTGLNGLTMPYGRLAFSYSTPLYGGASLFKNILSGGADPYIKDELSNILQEYSGYGILKLVYDDLKKTMIETGELKKHGNSRCPSKIRLSSSSEAKIQSRLKSLKETEDAVRKSIANVIQRNWLFKNSCGQINVSEGDPRVNGPGIPDDALKSILAKHSNLVGLSSAYNRKASYLIDTFQSLAKVILGSFNKPDNSAIGTESPARRPIRSEFHPGYGY